MASQERKLYLREWHRANPDKVRAHRKTRRALVKADPVLREQERARQRTKKAKRDPAKSRAIDQAFHRKNPNYRRDWKRTYHQTPKGNIENRLRARIHTALAGRSKTASTAALLGCSTDQLREHLESLFLPGMTWENRADWHIDHIRPCSSFDLLDPEQQRCCFHFTNLQPLWKVDNLRKHAKVAHV